MKLIMKLRDRWSIFTDTIVRFPLTITALIAAVITNTLLINTHTDQDNYIRLLVTFVLAAAIASVFQLLYERFFTQPMHRYFFMGAAVALSLIYYLLIKDSGWEVEVTIRTVVIFFILIIAFLWTPVIRSRHNFNESFMAVFKGFFISVFFTGVLFLGVVLIILAVDMLLFSVNEEINMHAANIIFVLLTPVYFLSLIPFYPRKSELEASNPVILPEPDQIANEEQEVVKESRLSREEALARLTTPTKFLESLITFVIIPITAVFTIILLLYIITNITGDFWTDNLMEPLLVSYSITVIIVYLLAAAITKPIAVYFRKIFPKVLVPVVLFQTISSLLKIGETGITYGRYYVILFGLFASIAGVLFCIKAVSKNGIIAPILIIMSVISILPPVDSFTISRWNQISRLETVLTKNNMLQDNQIVPKSDLSEKDRNTIITSIQYLNNRNNIEDISWLSVYSMNKNFEETFGFPEYMEDKQINKNIYLYREFNSPINIQGYDVMFRANVYQVDSMLVLGEFELNDKKYTVKLISPEKDNQNIVLESENNEIIRLTMNDFYNKYTEEVGLKNTKSTEELTYTTEKGAAILTIVADNISINEWENDKNQQADIYILIKIK